MNIASFYARNMLSQYDRQAISARRMARHRQTMRMAASNDLQLPAEIKRKIMVERVAKELFENLLFAGSDTPLVLDLQKELVAEFGDSLEFHYPQGSLEIVILRRTQHGTEPVTPQFRAHVLGRARELSLAKVEETLL